MEVALDAASLDVLGSHDPGPRVSQFLNEAEANQHQPSMGRKVMEEALLY